jgi:hypothetical protein
MEEALGRRILSISHRIKLLKTSRPWKLKKARGRVF